MKIVFKIEYRTRWGQELYVTGSHSSLGNFEEEKAVPMRYEGDGIWSLTLNLQGASSGFNYHYLVKEYGQSYDKEWGEPRTFIPSELNHTYYLYDVWQNMPADSSFYSSAFNKVILARHRTGSDVLPSYSTAVTLQIYAPSIRPDEVVALTGTMMSEAWSIKDAIIMDDTRFPLWEAVLDASSLKHPVEYKFLVMKKDSRNVVAWESGNNRVLEIPHLGPGENIVFSGFKWNLPLPDWRGAGVAIPVFSLRSEESWGIGEFFDLKKMVDWAVQTGQRFIQVLPVNDTTMTHTWLDSYPYRANSIFALHPAYLRVTAIDRLKDNDSMVAYEKLAAELNVLPEIDYERVTLMKWEYLKAVFLQSGKKTLNSSGFKEFFKANREWLEPYAAYCCLRDIYETPDFRKWKMYSVFNPDDIAEFCACGNIYYDKVSFYYFVQYHLHIQLLEVRDYAHAKGIVLKGDIPIGVSRDSVDAWSHPELFYMNSQAGAPPDDFSVEGQNWGFPTYNWDEMAKDGYTWWKARFRKMAEYFDAYRIDHILGFFRIWEIPENAIQGVLGHFNPAIPFSIEELQSYGFYFDEHRHAHPYIREYMLQSLFGEHAGEAIHDYLLECGYGIYALSLDFNTQRKIENHFCGKSDEKSLKIKSGLFALTDEILFVEDPYQKRKYHPCISARQTYSYKSLTDYERWCYDRLYVDFFYHRQDAFWKNEAMKKLPPLISSTGMLVCGEDLGMIPQSVPEVMNALQILSLEIQRMPKDPDKEFGDVANYPYLSVCTTSTHDMSGIRAWWEEDRSKTQRYYNCILQEQGEAPYYCEPWICEKILAMHMHSPSMLAIIPLQDWFSIDGNIRRNNPVEERINVPANPRNYWRYRMHITIEDLLKNSDFNERIFELVRSGGRE